MSDIAVSNYAQLRELFSDLLGGDVDFGNISYAPDLLQLKYHIEGEKYHSTLTPTIMRSILGLQDIINRLALDNLGDEYKRVPKELREKLEITYQVTDGSTNIFADLSEAVSNLKDYVSALSGKQKAAVVLTLIAVFSIKSLWDAGSDTLLKMKEKDLDDKRLQLEAVRDQNDHEEKIELMKMAAAAIRLADESREKSLRTMANESFEKITIDSQEFDQVTLKSRVKIERPRSEIIKRPLQSEFTVTGIDLSSPDNIYIDVVDLVDGRTYQKVDILADFISADDYKLIEMALNHEPIKMRLVLDYKNERLIGAILQSLVKETQ
jgi:hypothetical protein